MYIPPERAESNPNISGFIDESLYMGPGTQLQSQWEGNKIRIERILSIFHRLLININGWESSIKNDIHSSSIEINQEFNLLTKDVESLSKQAVLAVVSTTIHRDISNVWDKLMRIKQLVIKE